MNGFQPVERLTIALTLILMLINSSVSAAAEEMELVLWPEGIPEPIVAADPKETTVKGADGLTRRFNVSRPRLFVHLPEDGTARSGAAMIVAPGGGFARLADEHEGLDACRWLTSQGIVAFQLAYRTPTNEHSEPNLGPVMDAQRAIVMVRGKASEFGIQRDRIGLLGFSAGGQTALVASAGDYRGPAGDRLHSYQPDFLMLIYPYGIYDPKTLALRSDVQLDSGLPPTFIAQMGDDKASVPLGSALLYMELVKRKIPAELHIYETGGHGFGMRARANAPGTSDWALRATAWLKSRGLANSQP